VKSVGLFVKSVGLFVEGVTTVERMSLFG
jgi:hypothetical protein